METDLAFLWPVRIAAVLPGLIGVVVCVLLVYSLCVPDQNNKYTYTPHILKCLLLLVAIGMTLYAWFVCIQIWTLVDVIYNIILELVRFFDGLLK